MEKTVAIKIKGSNLMLDSNSYVAKLTEQQLRDALKEIEKENGWQNSYECEDTISRKLTLNIDKEFLWPTKEMALAARKLCKAMWEYKFDGSNFSDFSILTDRFYELTKKND